MGLIHVHVLQLEGTPFSLSSIYFFFFNFFLPGDVVTYMTLYHRDVNTCIGTCTLLLAHASTYMYCTLVSTHVSTVSNFQAPFSSPVRGSRSLSPIIHDTYLCTPYALLSLDWSESVVGCRFRGRWGCRRWRWGCGYPGPSRGIHTQLIYIWLS